MNMTFKSILLDGVSGVTEEYPAYAALKPGHLIEGYSDAGTAKVRKHSVVGGPGERMFALEDADQGHTTVDAYAAADIVKCNIAPPGARRLARLAAAAVAVALFDKLISAGDGTMKKAINDGAEQLYVNAAASTAVSNTVSTEQFYDVSYSLPANSLQVGDVLEIEAAVVVSAAAGTDTITGKLYLGSTAVATTAALDSTTNDVLVLKAMIVVRTIGASGTIVGDVYTGNGVAGTVTLKGAVLASTAIDTTAAQLIRASSTWSATTATCTSALQMLCVTRHRANKQEIMAYALEAVDNSAGTDDAFIGVRVAN
jgi:hypothetical protein